MNMVSHIKNQWKNNIKKKELKKLDEFPMINWDYLKPKNIFKNPMRELML